MLSWCPIGNECCTLPLYFFIFQITLQIKPGDNRWLCINHLFKYTCNIKLWIFYPFSPKLYNNQDNDVIDNKICKKKKNMCGMKPSDNPNKAKKQKHTKNISKKGGGGGGC